jgi:hypothetical protein
MNNFGFQNKTIMIFLNKYDLFTKKIQSVDLKVCWDDYTGGCDKDKACKFFQKKYNDANINKKRNLIFHNTTATDTKVMQQIFDVTRSVLLQILIEQSNL